MSNALGKVGVDPNGRITFTNEEHLYDCIDVTDCLINDADVMESWLRLKQHFYFGCRLSVDNSLDVFELEQDRSLAEDLDMTFEQAVEKAVRRAYPNLDVLSFRDGNGETRADIYWYEPRFDYLFDKELIEKLEPLAVEIEQTVDAWFEKLSDKLFGGNKT